jgi:hypothetical protein
MHLEKIVSKHHSKTATIQKIMRAGKNKLRTLYENSGAKTTTNHV